MKGASHGRPRYHTDISSGCFRNNLYQRKIQDSIPIYNTDGVNTDTYTNDDCGKDIPSFEYRPSQIGCRSGGNWTYG